MANEDKLDEHLRRMASGSMERRASAVDTDAALDDHQSRRDSPRASSHADRRWLAAAAAVVVVVVGVAAIAWPRGGGDEGLVVTETVATLPAPTGTVSVTTDAPEATTTTAPGATASASPSTVRAGGKVEITPAGSVQRTCLDIVTLVSVDTGRDLAGQIAGDDWVPASSSGAPVTYPACLGATSDETVLVTVPADVAAGDYEVCIAASDNPAGCATVTIETATPTATTGEVNCATEPLAPPSLVDGTRTGDPVIDEQADGRVVRWGQSDSPFTVSQALGFPIDTSWIDDAIAEGRVIRAGDWHATTVAVGDPPMGEITIYLRNTVDGCIRSYNVGPGLYSDQADALAEDWVIALSSGEPTDPASHRDIRLSYFGRRSAPLEAPFFEIDEFTATGSIVATLTDEQVAPLFSHAALSDGTRVRLDGHRSENRCINQPLVRSGATASDDLTTALSEARSIAVATNGKLLATRDVCPAGTKWGDPETFSELIEVDLTSATASVISLRTWQSDPDQIVFDDDDRVIALGERTLGDVSPDGRYVAVREQYDSDAERWSLIDLSDDATLLSPASICENAGDIVGPPRFVNDNVVIARLCTELHTGDDSQGGDVQIEAVDLTATQPSDSIVWNSSVPGLGVDNFTRSVDLSARQHTDNEIWAIVSGNGGLEISPQTYALHLDEIVEITRIGYQTFAFHAADLLTEFDTPPI